MMNSSKKTVAARSKHIDVQYWKVMDNVMKGDVKVEYVASEDMLADGLTKPCSGPAAQMNMIRIGMCVGQKK
jgi:hypothetical protein